MLIFIFTSILTKNLMTNLVYEKIMHQQKYQNIYMQFLKTVDSSMSLTANQNKASEYNAGIFVVNIFSEF